MPTAENLRTIKTFAQLVRYLEDELDWPLEQYGFEDLTFEYAPAEVGLRDEEAAKVRAIHQLRPLAGDQPWGIFFIEFEQKRLPVVVVRRILSHLVIKKRASANRADQKAFEANDLLLITAFGEETSDQREIAFAHFHQVAGDLPTLRVLGWDGADTPLKLVSVAATLQSRLRWPNTPVDHEQWRAQWTGAFRHRLGHAIRTANELAEALATLARQIRDAALTLITHESEQGPLRKLHQAFRTALIHDLSEADFADTYAQTITYGLLTAAISRTEMSEGQQGTALLAENVADIVPVTNPFLKEMLQTFLTVGGRQGGIDFDELGIQDVVELLRSDETNLPAVLRDFGNRTQGEDPVIHFYEHFLSAYNKKLKVQRGVFYTPQPVVSYIVRSVHELLQTEFGLEDGLASTVTWGEMQQKQPELKIPEGVSSDSTFVQILDPATGTATFLVEVIAVIHRTLAAKWKAQRWTEQQQRAAWNDYVPKYLLPRLHGYELMMAPYAIAHMKIGLKLHETGYRFQSEERVRVYLTNALEPASDAAKQQQFEALAPALAHEAMAVNEVKRNQRFTVVIGNPPYSVSSQNNSEWIIRLCDEFKKGLEQEKNIQPLSDDYIKFIRFDLFQIEKSYVGIIGIITNREFIQGIIHRTIRRKIIETCSKITICDLHGQRGELLQSSERDENVFEIGKGVSISIIRFQKNHESSVSYCELVGSTSNKNSILSKNSSSTLYSFPIKPSSPFWFFKPQDTKFEKEYLAFPSVIDFFNRKPVTGFATHRDHFAIDFSKEDLIKKLRLFTDLDIDDNTIQVKFDLKDTRDWKLRQKRKSATHDKFIFEKITLCTYRPFDFRWVIYSDEILEYSRRDTMQHIFSQAPAIIFSRIVKDEGFAHVFVSQFPVEKIFLSPKSSNNAQICVFFLKKPHRDFDISNKELLFYIYSILHSKIYRTRYAEFLKIDFPRLPLTSSLDLFRALSKLGGELVALHLMESPKLDQHFTTYTGSTGPVVDKVSWANNTVWLDKKQSYGFIGVPENVWNFHIGGYQVCNKWLKDRKGRTLSAEDLNHYQRIVVALAETIWLMTEIDEVIEQYGGWPEAFSEKSN